MKSTTKEAILIFNSEDMPIKIIGTTSIVKPTLLREIKCSNCQNVWSHQRKMQKQSKMPQMRRVALPINMYKQTCTLPELLRSTLKQLKILPLLFNLHGAKKIT